MKLRKTLYGAAAGMMALSAFAVSASAAQEAKEVTINLQTTVHTAETDVEANFYGKDLANIFEGLEGETLEFNFDLNVTLPSKYSDNWYNETFKGVTNIDGKGASLIIEGKNADGKDVSKKVALSINEDGYYEFSVVAADEVAGKNEVSADYFASVTDITFDGILSHETPMGTGYIGLPADAIGKLTAINWNSEDADNDGVADLSIPAFDKLISSETYTTKGVKGESLKGTFLEEGEVYNINDIYGDSKIAIVDTINTNKGATVTFNFLSQSEVSGLGWFTSWDNANLNPILDVSYSSLKKFAIALNLENTRLLQQTGEVQDHAVTFNWDELIAKSGLSAAAGDIDTIHIRSNSDLVLSSIVIKVPEAADNGDNELGAGNDQTDESVGEPEVTTAETEAAPNATTGNAPIALAAIPAAIAAAVVVAKKR